MRRKIINKNNVVVGGLGRYFIYVYTTRTERRRRRRRAEGEMNGFRSCPGDVCAVRGGGGDGEVAGRVKVAESISPAIIGSAGARKTPLINTSSRALDNLRPRAAE